MFLFLFKPTHVQQKLNQVLTMSEKGGKGGSLLSKGGSLKGKDDSAAKSTKGRRVQFSQEGLFESGISSLPKSGGKGGKGDKVANGGKSSLSKDQQPSEPRIDQKLPENIKCLMDCEAADVLQGINEQMVMLSRDPSIKIPECFDKGLRPLAKCGFTDSEICVIGNVCPETVDEVFALLPSLKGLVYAKISWNTCLRVGTGLATDVMSSEVLVTELLFALICSEDLWKPFRLHHQCSQNIHNFKMGRREDNDDDGVDTDEEELELEEEEEESAKAEKWKKHYSSRHRILLVGEGDFSFSLSLARAFGSAHNLVATSLDSQDSIGKKYSNGLSNVMELEERGCLVLYGVDAKNMSQHFFLKTQKFDRIVYNFPHVGFIYPENSYSQIKLNKRLLKGFLGNAKVLLKKEGGEIHVTHKEGDPYNKWDLVKKAEKRGLAVQQVVPFLKEDYPGYDNKRAHGKLSDASFPVGESNTYKFKVQTSLQHS
ncbi:hypothetical protein VNO77_25394 [Canavalia gladiata]|uniref:25S rRNA (uridine-N(3))-methyltransferase BMT5-like domain-containing protein n=1 Tax=Canavalia gladiata TaxID=3824 RepID=A0AAN9QDF5_CANGL